jgi:protein-S-isoprenylcysteine O-methyltransferase Ste14
MRSNPEVATDSSPSSALPRVVGRASDWAGFIAFGLLAIKTFQRMPELSILLLPTIAHELFTAMGFLIRDRARATHRHAGAQLAAYGGTFLVFGFFNAARTWRPELLTPTAYSLAAMLGGSLWLAGSLLAPFSVWTLRYSISIEPQARRMIRTGPYAYIRHPIYLGYCLQYGGLLMLYPSQVFAAALLIWSALTLLRIRWEEDVLVTAFPEYEEYRRVTGALLPLRFGKIAVVRSGRSNAAAVLRSPVTKTRLAD